jgi:hypothetical protein
MNLNSVSIVALVVLFILAGVTSRCVATKEEPVIKGKEAEPTPNKIVASRDFPAFTLLKEGDLQLRKGTDGSAEPDVSMLMKRYLLVGVKRGGEVKVENVAPAGATEVLDDSIAVNIPASPTTVPGGQLRVGELVAVVAVPAKEEAPIIKFDKVVVLNTVAANKEANLPGTITLAVPSTQRDDFARAIGRTQYFVTRRVEVHKQDP